jgi:hypothetical protein
VTQSDLAAPIRTLRDAGKLRTAGLLHSYIVRAFGLAYKADDNPDAPAAFVPFTMRSNPVADMKPIQGAAGETHEQVMTIGQLQEYATTLQDRPQSVARDILLLSLYCGGQRLAQVARATMVGAAVMVIMDSKGKRVPTPPLIRSTILVAASTRLSTARWSLNPGAASPTAGPSSGRA